MEQLTLDIEDLTPEQVTELLRIARDMRAAQHPRPSEATPEQQEADEAIHSIAWGRVGHETDPACEEAFDVFSSVINHGRHIGRDWAPLLIALAQRGGDPMDRDHARSLVTSDPTQAVHALRGLKQAFSRATAHTTTWSFGDTYTPHYEDPYSGVTAISLGAPFCAALLEVLHVD